MAYLYQMCIHYSRKYRTNIYLPPQYGWTLTPEYGESVTTSGIRRTDWLGCKVTPNPFIDRDDTNLGDVCSAPAPPMDTPFLVFTWNLHRPQSELRRITADEHAGSTTHDNDVTKEGIKAALSGTCGSCRVRKTTLHVAVLKTDRTGRIRTVSVCHWTPL
jgi:hypothetical protein